MKHMQCSKFLTLLYQDFTIAEMRLTGAPKQSILPRAEGSTEAGERSGSRVCETPAGIQPADQWETNTNRRMLMKKYKIFCPPGILRDEVKRPEPP